MSVRYEKASADYKQSADAVANAIQVLQQYYSQGSFAQVRRQPSTTGLALLKPKRVVTCLGWLQTLSVVVESRL